MFWTWLQGIVNLTFLILAITLLSAIWSNTKQNEDVNNISEYKILIERDVKDTINRNQIYTEKRVNKIAETQDSYQASTSQKVFMLEERIRLLESEVKSLAAPRRQQSKYISNQVINLTNNEK